MEGIGSGVVCCSPCPWKKVATVVAAVAINSGTALCFLTAFGVWWKQQSEAND